jgi:DNA polymerase-3 subunit delta
VNVQEFIRSIGASPPACVILFCPAKSPRARDATFEPFLAEQAVECMVRAYVDPGMKDLVYTTFYADEAKPAEIVLEARTVPFLVERRVVLVRNAERYAADAGADPLSRRTDSPLLSYLESPCEMTILMLVASQVDKRTRFYKACEKFGLVVECPELTKREVAEWVRREIEARNKSADEPAIEEIVRRAGAHLGDVNNAVTNVINYVGDAARIREEDVIAACADVAEQEVWALTDAIASSQQGPALTALHKLLDLGRREDEILGTVNWLLKSAYAIVLAGSGPPTVSPFVAKKVRPLADKLGMAKLRDAFRLCTDTHFMIRSTGVDATLALELLVVKLAAPLHRPKTAQA